MKGTFATILILEVNELKFEVNIIICLFLTDFMNCLIHRLLKEGYQFDAYVTHNIRNRFVFHSIRKYSFMRVVIRVCYITNKRMFINPHISQILKVESQKIFLHLITCM